MFFSVGEYGDVSSLNGGGEPFDHGSGAPHRVRPPLHLKLHLYLRKHDPEYFKEVVQPFINNKIEKTCVDYYLLDRLKDVCDFESLTKFSKLNELEMSLVIDAFVRTDQLKTA